METKNKIQYEAPVMNESALAVNGNKLLCQSSGGDGPVGTTETLSDGGGLFV